MSRNLARLATLFLALQMSRVAWPQAVTGSISGTITDNSGATVPSARLTLINAGTGAQRALVTNESGQFVISSVEPGKYTLTVQAPGFKTLQRTVIEMTPSEVLAVGNLALNLGAVEEKVTVTAEGAIVQRPAANARKPLRLRRRKNCLYTGAL